MPILVPKLPKVPTWYDELILRFYEKIKDPFSVWRGVHDWYRIWCRTQTANMLTWTRSANYSWVLDCKKGTKRKELNRYRKPCEDKVGGKLDEYYFRRTYCMARDSFDNLHGIFEPGLQESVFSKGGTNTMAFGVKKSSTLKSAAR